MSRLEIGSKYKKKPIVISALQLRWDTWNEMCNFVTHDFFGGGVTNGENIELRIITLEGVMIAKQNDYVIKGINGEFYPCNEEIFNKTYERVEE